jgi:type II secretory pathway pseudopilin PulG
MRLFIRTLSNPPRRGGLTILEMLVSTAMLSFIVLGLTAMLIQTQKAFKTGIKQNTVTDAGRSIMGMILGDLAQMSDSQDTNIPPVNYNFYWDFPANSTPITNYNDGVAIRTNELNDIFILEHANTTWVGVGYAVSNYPGVAVGALYRYETNWTSLAPAFSNDLFNAFYTNISNTNFPTNYWHQVADGVIDLRISAFDQFGNTNYDYQWSHNSQVSYPIGGYPFANPTNYYPSNALPNSVELELGILEPDTLVQVRTLARTGNTTALNNFLSSNAAPKMEVFRQRITIAAAPR